jgi:L-ascorbate metabolism protein UlaG (beta-lactamase superfamily)
MKKLSMLVACVLILVTVVACAAAPTATPVPTATPIPPTATNVPPSATPLPPTATATLLPPTSTPVPPTSTPRPSDTPEPTPTTIPNPPVLPTSVAAPTVLDRGGIASGKSQVEITFIVNEGFLLTSSRGEKILIDAMIGTDFPNYGLLTPEQRTLLGQALPPFDNINLILVTHHHADHFDNNLVKTHMQRDPRATLVSGSNVTSILQLYFPERVKTVNFRSESRQKLTVNGIEVEALELPHSPMIREPHMGFVFMIGGWRILHMADSEDLTRLPSDLGQIDVAFTAAGMKPPSQAKDVIQMHWKVPSPNKAMQKWILK